MLTETQAKRDYLRVVNRCESMEAAPASSIMADGKDMASSDDPMLEFRYLLWQKAFGIAHRLTTPQNWKTTIVSA